MMYKWKIGCMTLGRPNFYVKKPFPYKEEGVKWVIPWLPIQWCLTSDKNTG